MSFSSDQPLLSNQLPLTGEFPKEPKDFIDSFNMIYKRIANATNTREGSLYLLNEQATFQQYFSYIDSNNESSNSLNLRPTYRKVFDLVTLNGGSIAAGATVSFAHDITGLTSLTRMYGSATTAASRYLPLPYSSATLNLNIEIYLTTTNIVLINGSGQPALTQAYVVAEYLKIP